MKRTQVELESGSIRKVFWLGAKEGNILPGDKVTLIETPGLVWVVLRVCISLPEWAICVPYRYGTWQMLFRMHAADPNPLVRCQTATSH